MNILELKVRLDHMIEGEEVTDNKGKTYIFDNIDTTERTVSVFSPDKPNVILAYEYNRFFEDFCGN